MYLTYGIRSNIAFAIRKLSKYNANLQKNHLWATKWVVHYLKRIVYLELIYGQYLDISSPIFLAPYDLIGYGNSNFVRDPKDKKFVMEYHFFFNGTVVLWSNKK